MQTFWMDLIARLKVDVDLCEWTVVEGPGSAELHRAFRLVSGYRVSDFPAGP